MLSPLCFHIDILISTVFSHTQCLSNGVILLIDIVTALQMERFAAIATASTAVITMSMRLKDTKPLR